MTKKLSQSNHNAFFSHKKYSKDEKVTEVFQTYD